MPIQILKETGTTIQLTWYVDGTATDVGDVTIGIDDLDGNEIVAAGTATTNNGDGTYDYAIANTLTATVDRWVAKWTDTSSGNDVTQQYEIVGGYLFTEAEARAFDSSAIPSGLSDAAIAEARTRVTDDLETWTGISWVPRYARHETQGSGSNVLPIPHLHVNSVIAASINGTAITAANVTPDLEHRRLHRTDGTWTLPTTANPVNVIVEYEHGYRYLYDGVKDVALQLLRHRLVPSPIGDTTTSYNDELGTHTYWQNVPGMAGNVSSLSTVNEFVKRHRHLRMSML